MWHTRRMNTPLTTNPYKRHRQPRDPRPAHAPDAPVTLLVWARHLRRAEADGLDRCWGQLARVALCAEALSSERRPAGSDSARGECDTGCLAAGNLRRNDHGLCVGYDALRCLGSESYDRVPRPLSASRGDDLLAHGQTGGLRLFAAEALLFLRGDGHDPGCAAPLYRDDH
jgi:hypothetical protein